MTREEDLRRLLNDAATEIPAGNAPIAELVREGRRSKKLRYIVQAASVTAAVAVIAVGAFIVGPSVGGSGNLTAQPTTSPSGPDVSGGATTEPTASPSELAVPAGTRLVGMNSVAVEVPEIWSVNQTKCGTATSETVVFEPTPARPTCFRPERFPSLHVGSLDDPMGRSYVNEAKPAGYLDGVAVSRLAVHTQVCSSEASNLCFSIGALVVPSKDVVMWVRAPEESTIRQILNSARLMPEGYTAVPDVTGLYLDSEVKPLVESVGLLWENRCPDGYVCDIGPIEATDPAPGSVVPLGTTVRAAHRPNQEGEAKQKPPASAFERCEALVDDKTYTELIDAQDVPVDQFREWLLTRTNAYSPSQIADVPETGSVIVCALVAPQAAPSRPPTLGSEPKNALPVEPQAAILFLDFESPSPFLDSIGPLSSVTGLMAKLSVAGSRQTPTPTTATDNASKLTPCSEVVPLSAGVGEVNFWVDKAKGILEFSYSDPRTKNYITRVYTIAYNDDPTCRANPVTNELIERALPHTSPKPADKRTRWARLPTDKRIRWARPGTVDSHLACPAEYKAYLDFRPGHWSSLRSLAIQATSVPANSTAVVLKHSKHFAVVLHVDNTGRVRGRFEATLVGSEWELSGSRGCV